MSNDLSKQLCELCGIEGKEGQPECLSIDTPVCKRGFSACCAENCTGCKYFNRFEKVYPVFTPVKQLELIKLIGDFNCFQDEISNWVMTHHDINRVRSYRVEGNKDFSDTLANFILYLIVKKQLDKSEVKKILED